MTRSGPLSAEDARLLAETVRGLSETSAEALAAGQALARVRCLERGEALLRAGEPAREVALVARGCLREAYLLADGSERTKAFVFAGQSTGSLADLLRGGPSTAYILALEPSRLLCLPYTAYRDLCMRYQEWARLHLRVVETLLLHKAEREYELLAFDAAARYRALLERLPDIEQRVAAKHLASYLGITPVHLSRLRRARGAQ